MTAPLSGNPSQMKALSQSSLRNLERYAKNLNHLTLPEIKDFNALGDTRCVRYFVKRFNAKVPIPHDPDLYAMRNQVERFFCRMKDMRRLTTRYEKLKRNFLSMLYIFAIRCWLN